MAKIDKSYHDLLNLILNKGFRYEDPNRKDIFRIQIPSYQFIHDFKDGFPAITTKKLFWKGVVAELLWFLRGDTNIKYLVDNNINIWNKDAYNYYCKLYNNTNYHSSNLLSYNEWLSFKDENFIQMQDYKWGDLGRVYGAQWRNWTEYYVKKFNGGNPTIIHRTVDQISNLIKGLKQNPMGTRHIVTAWNPAELDDMALPPCHWSFEILVEPLSVSKQSLFKKDNSKKGWTINHNRAKYQFTLKWHQRSVDTFLGLPFNIASYALLAHIIGKLTNMKPKGIIGDLSNVHIYEPHLDAVKKQLSRNVDRYDKSIVGITADKSFEIKNPNINLSKFFNELEIHNFKLLDYESYDGIKAEMLSYNK